MSSVRNMSRVTIYKDPQRYVNQVSLALLQNGEVVAVFDEDRGREHLDNGFASLIRSRDGGKTWDSSKKVTVLGCDDRVGNWDPAVTQLAAGTLIVNICQRYIGDPSTWQRYDYETWMGTFTLKSHDNGETWSEPTPVNVRPMKHGGTRTAALELPDGTLLLGLYGRMTSFGEWPYNDYETSRAYLAVSNDSGDHWERYATLAYDPANYLAFQEPALVRLASGTLVCMVRAHTIPNKKFDRLYVMFSEDEGASWSLPKRTNIWGYPPHLLNLHDGRTLMTYGYRRPPGGVRGCISEDGLTWDAAQEFVICEGGHHRVAGWHTGYPSTVQLSDGTILTGYHLFSDDEAPVQYIQCSRYCL